MQYKHILSALLASSLFLFSCTSEEKQPDATASTSTETSTESGELEGFEAFFKRFHEDSVYQLEHITFPLEGLPSKADSTDRASGQFRWQKDSWVMHRPMPPNSGYMREYVPMGSTIVTEYTQDKQQLYGLVRRFAIIDDEWHLIYYAGVNRLSN